MIECQALPPALLPSNISMVNRKAHLKKLAADKRGKKRVRDDVDSDEEEYVPPVEDALEEEAEKWGDGERYVSGTSSSKFEAAYRQRRSRERLRGLGSDAALLRNWLIPAGTQAAPGQAVAEEIMDEIIESVLEAKQAEDEANARAQKAAEERAAYRKRKLEPVTPRESVKRVASTRASRTFSAESSKSTSASRKRTVPDGERKIAKAQKLTNELTKTVQRITKNRQLRRSDIVNGAKLSRAEYAVTTWS